MNTPRRKPRAAMWLRENCQTPTDECIKARRSWRHLGEQYAKST